MRLERFNSLQEANEFASQYDLNSSLMVKMIKPQVENGTTVYYVAVDNRTFGVASKDRSSQGNENFRK